MWVLYLIILAVLVLAFGQNIVWAFKKAFRQYQKLQRNKLAKQQQLLLKASLQNDFNYFYRLHGGDSQKILAEPLFQRHDTNQVIQQLLKEYNHG